MGDLSRKKITVPSREFQDVGLDSGGSFFYKVPEIERNTAYLALIICFASKVVHLKLVSHLTTAACIAALRRFTSLRGCPKKLYSDIATKFTGSKWELEKLSNNLNPKHQGSLQAAAAGLLIEWKFIPPHAPDFGHLWEARIKSAHHLGRTRWNAVLSFKELTILFCLVENILNLRMISVFSDEMKDGEVSTPSDLICGTKLETFLTVETTKK